jgi:hypothetical protein
MSYDLAVWEAHLSNGGDVDEVYWAQMEELEAVCDPAPPSPAIHGFVDELLRRWPSLEEPGGAASPWAGPVLDDAMGPFVYFTLTWSGAQQAVPTIAQIARDRGLVCYDPQRETAV